MCDNLEGKWNRENEVRYAEVADVPLTAVHMAATNSLNTGGFGTSEDHFHFHRLEV